MADEFDADALLMILDATEYTGAPPHLVERLRDLVRERHARTDGTTRLGRPDGVRVTRNLPDDDLGGIRPSLFLRRDPSGYRADLEWHNGDSLSGELVEIVERTDPAGFREATVDVGGHRFLVPMTGW